MSSTNLRMKDALTRWASAGTGPLPRLVSHLRMPLYKNGYALILSSATTSGLGMLFWVLAAHYYSVETIGTSSAMIAAMMFLSGLSQRGVNSALVRFVPLAGRASTRLVGLTYLISLIISGAATLLIGRVMYPLFPILGVLDADILPLLLFAGIVMIWSVFTLQDSVLTGLGQAQWVPIENTLVSAIKIGLLVLLAHWLPIEGVLAAWLIPVVISIAPVNLLIFRRLLPAHTRATADQAEPLAVRPLVKYVSGNHAASLFMLAYATLLPVMVASQAGARANAYFYPPWMIATSLQLVAINMTTSLTVEGTRDRPQLTGVWLSRVRQPDALTCAGCRRHCRRRAVDLASLWRRLRGRRIGTAALAGAGDLAEYGRGVVHRAGAGAQSHCRDHRRAGRAVRSSAGPGLYSASDKRDRGRRHCLAGKPDCGRRRAVDSSITKLAP